MHFGNSTQSCRSPRGHCAPSSALGFPTVGFPGTPGIGLEAGTALIPQGKGRFLQVVGHSWSTFPRGREHRLQ